MNEISVDITCFSVFENQPFNFFVDSIVSLWIVNFEF